MLSRVARQVKSPNEMPTEKHFAILVFTSSSFHVPGDERSRRCPGHGYPEHTETVESCEYWVAKDVESLKSAIKLLDDDRKSPYSNPDRSKYQVVEVRPVTVHCKVEIDLT
jgi:hypothetical protein